jgi:hypothetical protein
MAVVPAPPFSRGRHDKADEQPFLLRRGLKNLLVTASFPRPEMNRAGRKPAGDSGDVECGRVSPAGGRQLDNSW